MEGLCNLSQLEELNFEANKFLKIEGLENLSKLKEFSIYKTGLSDKDREIYDKGVEALVNHCKNIKKKRWEFNNWFFYEIKWYNYLTTLI